MIPKKKDSNLKFIKSVVFTGNLHLRSLNCRIEFYLIKKVIFYIKISLRHNAADAKVRQGRTQINFVSY